jgi:hypothetical protein
MAVNWTKIYIITSYSCIALYALVLLWTLANFKIYVVDQKRYKTSSVLTFYILAIAIVISRILMFVNVITIYSVTSAMAFWKEPYVYDFNYVICMFLIVVMGFY